MRALARKIRRIDSGGSGGCVFLFFWMEVSLVLSLVLVGFDKILG